MLGTLYHACLELLVHDRNHNRKVHFFQRNLDAKLENESLANLKNYKSIFNYLQINLYIVLLYIEILENEMGLYFTCIMYMIRDLSPLKTIYLVLKSYMYMYVRFFHLFVTSDQ